ncbi:phosphoenolpyruvate carboxykinase (ATP) [Pseudomonadota bacterium]
MSTLENYSLKDSELFNKITSKSRTTIQTAFLGNNVEKVGNLAEVYKMAKNSSGTIELTGMPVYKPEELDLPSDANALLFNDGETFGRCAVARRILGQQDAVNEKKLTGVVREAVYGTRFKKMYYATSVVGLDKDFMIKAHLLIPEGFENTIYSWMLNFQHFNKKYTKMYKESKKFPEGDIYIFSDPTWKHPDFPYGLTFFDPEYNVAAILGMRYFGEHKKATLTLAWSTAIRHGYACCHGGLKRYNIKNNKKFTVAVFGLSGSGKSTITHAKHNNKYDITILHDDAFIINIEDKYSMALEPSYFDKTNDYPMNSEENKFLLTAQNNGAVRYDDGKVYIVTEDVRNGNGRGIKSKLWSSNRVDRVDDPINAIFWIMKDPTIPPVIKLKNPSLGAVMGATLATKRTSAEKLAEGVDPNALVVEPYANPFRTYPLGEDYKRFKKLIKDGVDCYVLNTGDFMSKKIGKKITLEIIEKIVEGSAKFEKWAKFSDIEIMHIKGFETDFKNTEYRHQFRERFKDRIKFIISREFELGGVDRLPSGALKALSQIISEINKK